MTFHVFFIQKSRFLVTKSMTFRHRHPIKSYSAPTRATEGDPNTPLSCVTLSYKIGGFGFRWFRAHLYIYDFWLGAQCNRPIGSYHSQDRVEISLFIGPVMTFRHRHLIPYTWWCTAHRCLFWTPILCCTAQRCLFWTPILCCTAKRCLFWTPILCCTASRCLLCTYPVLYSRTGCFGPPKGVQTGSNGCALLAHGTRGALMSRAT